MKYNFQTDGDATGAEDFNAYVDQLLAQNQVDNIDYEQGVQQPVSPEEEDDYIANLRAYDEEYSKQAESQELDARFASLNAKLDQQFQELQNTQDNFDYFSSDEGIDFLTEMYNVNNNAVPFMLNPTIPKARVTSYTESNRTPSSENFSGIFQNEGARTGQPANLINSSAIGRGQMIKGTRELMYQKLGIPKEQFAAAEQQFKKDPDFEMKVLNAYREDLDARIPENITGQQREYMIAKGWYTGNPFYPDNVVPGKSAGNKLTAGEYARRAVGKK